VKRSFFDMRVALGELARTGLESRVGSDVPGAVNTALVYYVGKLESGRGPAKYPRFAVEQGFREEGSGGDPESQVEVEVDEKIEAALEREAAAQGTTAAAIARHAVLVYLAELDRIGEPDPVPQRRVHA
jgi:hypothetical protein